MAGSVAFFASVSLIPLGLLLISAVGHLIGSEQAYTHVEAALQDYFPGSSTVLMRALDTTRTSSGRWLVDIVGTLALLWSGMHLFTALSMILTTVWSGEPKRSYFGHKAISFVAVLAAGLIFLASTVIVSVVATVSSYANSLSAHLDYFGYVNLLNSAISWTLHTVIAVSLFFALYRLLPGGRVTARAALLAAVPAGLLWIASRSIFSLLVAGSSRYGQLYGPLAGAVVLLLWIYYSAFVMIFCAELGAAAQDRYWREGEPTEA
jgi:membrane protein